MESFRRFQGVAAPLLRVNVDTDAIIPSREIRTVGRSGLSDGLFAGWRYRDAATREPAPEFMLNQPAYRGTAILLAGANFGCGSSREHAVWALKEFGIRAILAPSFGSIFEANCVRNGLLPGVMPEATVAALAARVAVDPQAIRLTIDLENCRVEAGDEAFAFAIASSSRHALLAGLDPIAQTLGGAGAIASWFAEDRLRRPWLYTPNEASETQENPS